MNAIEKWTRPRWANPTERWSEKSKGCVTDLRIKKMALALICTINIGAIGALFVYLTLYCPLPQTIYFITPFIGGVLAALLFLKLPTGGLNSYNYRDLTSPAMIIGKVVTVILFGPTVIVRNYWDWNDYSDPAVARKVKKDLEGGKFIEVMESYAPNLDNLRKYGVLSSRSVKEINAIYERYKGDLYTYRLLERRSPESVEAITAKLEQGEKEWKRFMSRLILPEPEIVIPEFSWYERVSLWYSSLTSNVNSISVE